MIAQGEGSASDARSARALHVVALSIVSLYVAASAALFAYRGDYLLAAGHVALLAILAILAIVATVGYTPALRRAPTSLAPTVGPRPASLVPLVVAAALYRVIPRLIAAAGTQYHDASIQQLERTLFHTQPAHTLAAALPYLPLSELLHFGYMCFYPMIFIPPLILLAKRRRRGYEETILALTLTWIVCWVLFVAFPVEGPRYAWGAPPGIPVGPMRRLATAVLAAESSRGAAFPSSHMAVSVTQTICAWRFQTRGVAIGVTVVNMLVGFGAVYGGFHYGVDMLAGTALGAVLTAAVVLRPLSRRAVAPQPAAVTAEG